MYIKKDSILITNGVGKINIHMQKDETRYVFVTLYKKKVNFEWMKDLDVRPETLKPLEEKTKELKI